MLLDRKKLRFKLVHFNELTREETYEMAKARFEVFVCEQKIISENDFDDKDKECYHLLAYYDYKLVGYCRILPKGVAYDEASIGRVLVLKEYRKQNICQEMMNIAIKFIVNELEYNKIILSAQCYIKELYKSVGFREISDIYDEVGIPHVKMMFEKEFFWRN